MPSANRRCADSYGYAKYVGRVGALAVALGVSGAAVTTPGIAWAEDSATGSSTSKASTSKASSKASAPRSSSDSPRSRPSGKTSSRDAKSPGSSSGTDDSDSDNNSDPAEGSAEELTEDPADNSGTDPDAEAQQPAEQPEGPVDAAPQSPAPRPATTQAPATRIRAKVERGQSPADAVPQPGLATSDTPATATGAVESGPAGTTDSSPLPAVSATITPTALNSVAPTITLPAAPPEAFLSAAVAMISAALAPILAPTPDSPAESPLMWALLGWVRRQTAELSGQTRISPAAQTTANATAAAQGGLPAEFEREIIVSGLNEPTDFRILADGRILIAQKDGTIVLWEEHDGVGQLREVVKLSTSTGGERGLSGIETAPDFAETGHFYVSYTGADNIDRLTRLTMVGDTASLDSEVVLMAAVAQANNVHHGGEIRFGPDGMLYWSTGDNFYSPNPQNLGNMHGKILRIDPNNPGVAPAGNPFINTPGALSQIWAYGMRNPFRFVFTPNGKLLSTDVGGARWEELNIVVPGANYGWPLAEGVCTGPTCAYVNPIYTYPHTPPPAVAGSITGVLVYTGAAFGEEYTNKVFIADYTLGWIKVLTFDENFDSFISEEMFDAQAGTTVKLEQGLDGNIYQLNIYPGELSVIRPSLGNKAPTAVITPTTTNGLGPLTVGFSSNGSSDPEGSPLSYSWDFGDGNSSTEANPTYTFTANGNYDVVLTVSDGDRTTQTTQRIVVGNRAPVITEINVPGGTQYNAGDVINFSGSASDPDGDSLQYSWRVDFHHADHRHPFIDNVGGTGSSFTIPRTSDNIDTTWYRITLTVTDTNSGLTATDYIDVKPNLVDLTIKANDPDAIFTVDGIPYKGSYTTRAVVGVERVIAAVSQTVGDRALIFGNWSNGQGASHTITTPGTETTYTVSYIDYVSPASLDPQVVLTQMRQNLEASGQRITDGFSASAAMLAATQAALPTALQDAIAEAIARPAEFMSIMARLATDLGTATQAATTPLVTAIADVVTIGAARTTGAISAVVFNVVPIATSIVNAPVHIGARVFEAGELLVRMITAWDLLGVQAALQYGQLLIDGEIAAQQSRIAVTISALLHDVLDALEEPLPAARPPVTTAGVIEV